MERCEVEVRIVNERGLHARPCHALVSQVLAQGCPVRVRCGAQEVDARSILELMTLGACCGDLLVVSAAGPGAREAVEAVVALIASGFGE